jgi:hypothetical protein
MVNSCAQEFVLSIVLAAQNTTNPSLYPHKQQVTLPIGHTSTLSGSKCLPSGQKHIHSPNTLGFLGREVALLSPEPKHHPTWQKNLDRIVCVVVFKLTLL